MTSSTSTAPQEPAQRSESEPTEKSTSSAGEGVQPVKLVIGAVGLVVTVWVAVNLFLAISYYPQWFGGRLGIGAVAIVAGVGGAFGMFSFLNVFIEALPRRFSGGLIPYAFLLPGFSLVVLILIYPTIQTIHYSFANSESTAYVGLENYRAIFADGAFLQAIFNNVLWIIVVPAATVVFGVIVAVLADKLSATGEKAAKGFIFLPMAISFVGASAIWVTLVYAYSPPGEAQTGLLNAVFTGLGGEPQAWLNISAGRLNSLLLMVILIWLQVGFAMILLSSAIKGVPQDTVEAARIDGANEFQVFWRVTVPQIKTTIITVYITVLILVMKVFDIVYVVTNGSFKTEVIANLFFKELFNARQAGQAAAIVVVLLIAVLPVMYYQIKAFRREEAGL
ncbi:MAG TPA: sugar ABC transporter permease [Ornithinimicrobium sp.]|uniref:carbohydrate ABC transporter permease n=1 Tax=Ornithinimicrobium sp. TaxID=1977084 RepID=UPI002B4A7169|nr:sugar ABC transporter permease [Ornithinimicrobium sp.]HKJ12707.1 sugar ABC transporter permease [Ornithinimicrobium sp.]